MAQLKSGKRKGRPKTESDSSTSPEDKRSRQTFTAEFSDEQDGEAPQAPSMAAELGKKLNMFQSLGEYVKAREYHEKAPAISMEIGDKRGEGEHYGNLGTLFHSLGEYVKAKEYYDRALKIQMEIRNREGQVRTYIKLATVFQVLNQYRQSKSYCDEALAISMESDDKEAEAICYEREGLFFQCLGDKEKPKPALRKHLPLHLKLVRENWKHQITFVLGKCFNLLEIMTWPKNILKKHFQQAKILEMLNLNFQAIVILH